MRRRVQNVPPPHPEGTRHPERASVLRTRMVRCLTDLPIRRRVTMSLTSEQVRLFRHNGFLKLPRPLPVETVERLKETIWRNLHGEVAPVVRDKQGRLVRISNLWGRDPVFDAALTCAQVL